MDPNTKSRSVALFREMVSGHMDTFAEQFGTLIWQMMPNAFLGRKESVYLAYACAFFTAASEAANTHNSA